MSVNMEDMTHVQRFDHIGITVADLDSATAFFVTLGLVVEGTGSVQGEFVETLTSRRRSMLWQRTDTGSLGEWASGRPACEWRTCGGPRASSSRCSSRSVDVGLPPRVPKTWRRTEILFEAQSRQLRTQLRRPPSGDALTARATQSKKYECAE